MRGESGPRWLHLGVSFEYTLIEETHYGFEMDGRLPLSMTVHESLDCVPLEDGRCRVNYHCSVHSACGVRQTRRSSGTSTSGGFNGLPLSPMRVPEELFELRWRFLVPVLALWGIASRL